MPPSPAWSDTDPIQPNSRVFPAPPPLSDTVGDTPHGDQGQWETPLQTDLPPCAPVESASENSTDVLYVTTEGGGLRKEQQDSFPEDLPPGTLSHPHRTSSLPVTPQESRQERSLRLSYTTVLALTFSSAQLPPTTQ